MTYEELDIHFVSHIVNEIAKYANENGMEVDDTIGKIAEWLLGLIEIATFNNFKGDWERQEE